MTEDERDAVLDIAETFGSIIEALAGAQTALMALGHKTAPTPPSPPSFDGRPTLHRVRE